VQIIDVGDVLPNFGFTVTDNSTGALAAPTSFTVTLRSPDGTTPTVSVENPSTGIYAITHVATTAGLWVAVGVSAGNGTDGAVTLTWNVTDDVASVVSVAEVRSALGLTATLDDEIRDLAATATQLVEDHTGRTWRRITVTETYDGGREAVVLRRTPVQSVTAVTEAGTALTQDDWLLDTDAGILFRGEWGGGRWASYPRSVVVTYVAGPAVVPSTIRQAVIDLCRHIWHRHLTASSSGRYGATDEIPDTGWLLPMHVRQSLDGYRAPGIA